MRRSLAAAAVAVATAAGSFAASAALASPSGSATSRVLLVCNGSTTPCPATKVHQYQTIQAAVDAASPGDWVLIWPGVYHENNPLWHAGVWVGTRDLHIRGLNRNEVIIDGSKGTAAHPCPSAPSLQNYAPRDGLVVAASGVFVENLTVCDYLGGSTGHGNQIWWNGGDATGKIGMGSYYGAYLTATAQFRPPFVQGKPSQHFAQYGIFVSNASGPGAIVRSYASNMADSSYYVGACQRVCHALLSHDVATNSALGYSGTNAGGPLIIRNSLFYRNRTGIAPNSLNNDDAPPPQDGRCPRSSRLCTVIEHNVVVGNNNPNTPFDPALAPLLGVGIELSGGSYDTVRGNLIKNQGSYGVLAHDYPDNEVPPAASHCQGGFPNVTFLGTKVRCDFPARGNRIYSNVFVNDGFFGNPTNSDLATIGLFAKSAKPRNCFFANHALRRGHRAPLTSSPLHIERPTVDGPSCGRPGTWNNGALLGQLLCLAYGLCPANTHYPVQTKLDVVPLPKLPSLPHPCAGPPANAYCRR